MTRFMSRLCKLFTGLMSSLGVMFIVRHIIQALVNRVCYDVADVDVDSVISNYLKIKAASIALFCSMLTTIAFISIG